jgi:hypothetical protein
LPNVKLGHGVFGTEKIVLNTPMCESQSSAFAKNEQTADFMPDASNPNILHPSGGGVFTAANGDKLNFVIINGALELTTGIGTGDFAFTGGTARFANATGQTSGVIQQNVVTGAYVLTLVGTIDY